MEDKFKKLRELERAATPGPWEVVHGGVIEDCYDNSSVLNRPGFGSVVFDDPEHVDAALICELRNRAGELLDAAERSEILAIADCDRHKRVSLQGPKVTKCVLCQLQEKAARCEQLEKALREADTWIRMVGSWRNTCGFDPDAVASAMDQAHMQIVAALAPQPTEKGSHA